MSDKPMTPDEYLRENPTALIFRNECSKRGETTAMFRPGNGEGWKHNEDDILIDWTGYTEPHLLIGPEFPQSRKRVVIWTAWMDSSHMLLEKPYDIREHASDKNDEVVAVRYGKYIDEPSIHTNGSYKVSDEQVCQDNSKTPL